MAGGADHEGLAPLGGHELRPSGLRPSWLAEVGEFADLVDFHVGPRVRSTRTAGQEPGDQFLAADGPGGKAVGDDRLLLPFQRNAAEPWRPVASCPAVRCVASKQIARPVRRGRWWPCACGPSSSPSSGAWRPASSAARSPLPSAAGSAGRRPGEQVVLDDAPVLGAVGADDRRVVQVHQLGAPLGFAVLEVGGAFGLDHRRGTRSLTTPLTAGRVAAVLDGDLVAEEGAAWVRACVISVLSW